MHYYYVLLFLVLCVGLSVQQVLFNPSCTFNSATPLVSTYYSGLSHTVNAVNVEDFLSSPPPVGGVIMIIQMQAGTINPSNSATYGRGFGDGKGYISMNGNGYYEFNVITSVSGGPGNIYNIDLQYAIAGNFDGTGAARFQVVLVPFCETATVFGSSASYIPWNGRYGGVAALLAHNFELNGIIDLDGKGFRGGEPSQASTGSGSTSQDLNYADTTGGDTVPTRKNAFKGEGSIGMPRIGSDASSYPNQEDSARGSPGSAGGGGNFGFGGGGGGSNGGNGGDGASVGHVDRHGIGAVASPVNSGHLYLGAYYYII